MAMLVTMFIHIVKETTSIFRSQICSKSPRGISIAKSHNKIRDINTQIYEQKIIIELLEKAERIFNSMTFDIKNIIDVMKLEVE